MAEEVTAMLVVVGPDAYLRAFKVLRDQGWTEHGDAPFHEHLGQAWTKCFAAEEEALSEAKELAGRLGIGWGLAPGCSLTFEPDDGER